MLFYILIPTVLLLRSLLAHAAPHHPLSPRQSNSTTSSTVGPHRVVVYYQHQYTAQGKDVPTSQWGEYISPLPLAGKATHLNLAAIHVNDHDAPAVITINDNAPSDPAFDAMWADIGALRAAGVPVLGMLGGAQPGGCFWRLSQAGGTFDTYYPYLRDFVDKYQLDGLDLDVEELQLGARIPYSLADMQHLIATLKADFGNTFLITQAPVARALSDADPAGYISGFSYVDLERAAGASIAWYNAQFYEGWGPFDADEGVELYEAIVRAGFASDKVVAGTASNPANVAQDDGQYVDVAEVAGTVVPELVREFGTGNATGFGGVAAWEYYNALPGGTKDPSRWAAVMRDAMAGA